MNAFKLAKFSLSEEIKSHIAKCEFAYGSISLTSEHVQKHNKSGFNIFALFKFRLKFKKVIFRI